MYIKSTAIALVYFLCGFNAYAVLPPGYEDIMYCPPDYCDRYISHGNSRFVGPASSFHECYNPETGDVVDEVWTGSLSDVVAPEGWVESPPVCEPQQGQSSAGESTCEDNLQFKIGKYTCSSIHMSSKSSKSSKASKSSKSMRYKKGLLCTDEEVALNCPRSCGLCVSQDDDVDTSSIPEDTLCTCYNANQLTNAVQAIQNNQTEYNQVSCTPGSNFKSITYQLRGGDPYYPYRYGVVAGNEAMSSECFQFDMHFLIDETTYTACKVLMESACAQLSD